MSRALPGWAVLASGTCAFVVLAGSAFAGQHDALITKHASNNGVPESLVRRVIYIESKGNPRVISKGNYGLMQIRLGTAKSMGYGGTAEGLLDADTNMTYAVKYLAGAYKAAGGSEGGAVANYARGYYAQAKRRGMSPYEAPGSDAFAMQPAASPTLVMQTSARGVRGARIRPVRWESDPSARMTADRNAVF